MRRGGAARLGAWSCVLVDLHHYNNPHDLNMISVMYTTCSYHGDQPLGEYLSHVSLAPYSGFQTAGERMHAWWQPPACTWGYFFPEIWETVVLVLLPKVIHYIRIVFSLLYSTTHQIWYGSYHSLIPRPLPPFTSGRGLGNICDENVPLYVATGLKKCSTNQIATFVHVTKHHVNWFCSTWCTMGVHNRLQYSRVCDQAGDKREDKWNTRGLSIVRHCWKAVKTKRCGSWCLLKTLSPAFLLSKVSPYWTEPTWWFCHRSSHRSASHCRSQLYYTNYRATY